MAPQPGPPTNNVTSARLSRNIDDGSVDADDDDVGEVGVDDDNNSADCSDARRAARRAALSILSISLTLSIIAGLRSVDACAKALDSIADISIHSKCFNAWDNCIFTCSGFTAVFIGH